jgi:hypothetical protein
MAGATPIYSFPYPESSDLVAAYPALGQDLAEDIETVIAALPTGGLTHIATQSFSAVSSVSLNGVFTSAYDNYRIIINYVASTATDVRLRVRLAGTDDTTGGSYVYQRLTGAGSSAGAASAGANAFDVTSANTNHALWSADILGPELAARTGFLSLGFRTGGETVWVGAGSHTQTTAYDGFTFFPASGNITGTLRVYGYANS